MILFMYQSRNNVIVELEGRVAVPGLAAGWGRVGAAIPGSHETVFRDYSAERLDWAVVMHAYARDTPAQSPTYTRTHTRVRV